MNEKMERGYVGICGILLRTRITQILRKMILPNVKKFKRRSNGGLGYS
jgi:hypothetical protein